jgi:ATPase subunit of ABC transporter with duplicated ATPase domains
MEEGEARTFLHRFLLTGFQTLRPLSTLSDGQRMRVALALLMAAAPDLLLLDEPTAHLDLDTVDALEDALASFSGAILAVSHDRQFLEHLAPDETWLLQDGVLVPERAPG